MPLKNLNPNSWGSDVKELHNQLAVLNYAISGGELAREFYGSSTAQAVRDIQAANKLPATGIADAETIALINKKLGTKSEPGGTTATVETTATTASIFVSGDGSPVITAVQKGLVSLGYSGIGQEEINTGLLGESTCKALTSFRAKMKMPACMVDSNTADRVNRLLAGKENKIRVSAPLVYGMKSGGVADLQNALQALGFATIAENEKGFFGDSTCKTVQRVQKELQLTVNGCYIDQPVIDAVNSQKKPDPEPAPADPLTEGGGSGPFKVSGYVYSGDRHAIADARVIVFDVDLIGAGYYDAPDLTTGIIQLRGGMEELGRVLSDKKGFWELRFDYSGFRKTEDKDNLADIIAYAYGDGVDADKKQVQKIIGRSRLQMKKDYVDSEVANCNIYLGGDLRTGKVTEYALLRQAIDEYFTDALQLFQIADSVNQVSFLGAETGQDPQLIAIAAGADKLRNSNAQISADISWTEIFYGIGRQNTPMDWVYLGTRTKAQLLIALQQSINENRIAWYDDKDLDQIVNVILGMAEQQLVSGGQDVTAGNMADLLKLSFADDRVISEILGLYKNSRAGNADFWSGIRAINGVTEEAVKSFQYLNQLTALTGSHLPLIKHLFEKEPVNDIKELMKKEGAEWNKIITETGVPGLSDSATAEEKASAVSLFAASLQNKLDISFPTERTRLMVEGKQTLRFGFSSDALRDRVNAFFSQAPDMDIRNNIQKEIDTHLGAAGDQTARDEVLRIQRLYQLSPSVRVFAMIKDKYHSANQVAEYDEDAFVEMNKNELSDQEARDLHGRATHIKARTDFLMLLVNNIHNGIYPGLPLNEGQRAEIINELNKIPGYGKLFG